MPYMGIGGSGIQDVMGDVQAIKGNTPTPNQAEQQGNAFLSNAMQRYSPQAGRADRLQANIFSSGQ